jgi:glycosyltransferase involved in cell wall biosynthesis
MGREMARFYQSPAPVTLYNSFPWEERSKIERSFSDRKDASKPSLIWFSQTIGPGRGLELLIEALRLVESPVELHLRGNCNQAYQTRLKSFFPYNKNHQLYIHPLVSNEQLISRIAEHDIGLALEQQEPLGRNLTITNKILQYLLAGVAVIAATTKGQKEVADKASDAVFLVKNGDAAQLAEKIDFLIKNKTTLAKAKIASLNVAQNYFCWEKQEIVLLQQVEKCFAELTLT